MSAFLRMPQKLPQPVSDYLEFSGGLDLVTPSIQTKPGSVREASNFEVGINGRYERIAGYERFDGQSKPSDAQYARLDVTITGSVSAGDTVTGVSSGATGVVVLVDTSGTPNFLVITKITDTFSNPEDLNVTAVKQAETLSLAIIDGAATPKLHAAYKNLAADEYRADIAALPGAGDVLGVWMLNDVVYAFRNNAGNTEADMFESSSSGWVQVALGFELPFTSGGTYEVVDGDTITGQGSGSTATVARVVLQSGSWAAGTAVGKFVFASQSGPFQSEDLDVGGNTDVATIAADSTAITLLPDGRYEFVSHNFGGQAGTLKMYGCDTVNRGFEFDGTTFVPVDTGMTVDVPIHVRAHRNHLFFSFAGSAQHSGLGFPYQWTIVSGASEIAVGADITAFQSEPGGEGNAALGIYTKDSIHILYGTDSSSWNLVKYRDEVGAFPYSVRQIGTTIFMDDRGVMNLRTVQAFGNFQHNTVTRMIQPWINDRKSLVTGACIVREKSQVRFFFSNNSALYITLDGNFKPVGLMPVDFLNPATCTFSLEMNDGSEAIMFGSDNGFVYELEKGTSFDGEAIDYALNLHFHHSGSPRFLKRYTDVSLEVAGSGYGEFSFTYELGYGDSEIPQPGSQLSTMAFAETRWDSFTWDQFFWDGVTLKPINLTLNGNAENISMIIRGSSDEYVPFQISGALLRYIPRRPLR